MREVGKKMKASKEEWIEEQYKNIEKRISGNGREAYNTLEAHTKAQQHKSAVI